MPDKTSICDLLLSRRETVALFFTALLSGAVNEPKFFSADDFQALQGFTEILIPTDENPGAREAKCAQFIDFLLQSADDVPHTQEAWRKAMAAVKETGFHSASPERRLAIVTEMAKPEIDADAKHPAFFAYPLIKQQTAFAFYTSREGMMETLHYKGNSYNLVFPACTHPEHQVV